MFAFFKKLFGKADVNKDGKVDVQDAKAVAETVKTETKAAVAKAKDAVKKPGVKAKTARTKKAKPTA